MKTLTRSGFVLSVLGLLSVLFSFSSAHAAPGYTTYQARIIKPDGLPLVGVNVSFRFTILDPAASCVLYVENYSAINMAGGGGLVSFALGMGTRTFPVSGTSSTFSNTFDNSIAMFNCQTVGTYNPSPNDNRKVVMQFNDGNGWQTLPAMAINAVPYAMYAGKSENSIQFNGKSDSAFVEYSTLAGLSCAADQAIKFNGVSFSCITVGSGGGGGITSVTTSGSVLSTGGTASAPVISIAAASFSQDGYLTSLDYTEFKSKLSASATQIINTIGFAPVSGAAVTAQINSSSLSGDVSGTLSSTSIVSVGGKTAAQIAASVNDTQAASSSAVANTLVKRDSSGHATFNDINANAAKLNYVDIYKPSTSYNIRLQAPTSLSTNYVLNLPTTSGTTGQVLSTDGSGNLSWVNPSTGSVTSVSATAPLASTGGSTPTISITQATSATAGYLSSVDWNTFNNKQAATSAAIIATLGYTPANSASIVSSQWTTSGSDIHYTTGNVGVGTSSPAYRLDVAGGSLANDTSIYFTQLNSASAKFNAVQLDPYVATATAGSETTGLSIGTKTGGTTTWSVDFADNIYTYVPINANAGSTFLNRNVSSSSAHSLAFYKRRTAGSVLANDNLAWIPGYGHTGSGWAPTYSAAIGIRTTENISSTAAGGQLWFETTPNGTITPQNRMVIDQNGNVGIGVTTPVTKLDVSGGMRIGIETTACVPALAGTLRYNTSNVEYCNGSSWQAFGISGAGITNFNGSTSGTQSFAVGTGGTAPNFNTSNGVHTFSIPLASAGSVTAGLISNADYAMFANKITSSSASIAQVLGYVPADNSVSGTYAQKANNLSDLTNVATARTNLGLGTFATANTIDLGGASATGTLAIARLPSFTGDATIAAASNTIVLLNSGVIAGTYSKVTVDNKGRVTSGAQITSGDVTTALGYTPASASASTQWTTSGTAIFYNAGNVGIGTTSPSLVLDVSGSVRSRPVAVATTVTSIDWSSGNIQYTPDSCGSFVFNNIADGAAYTFVVKGATAATCNITFYSGNGSGALTAHFTPANAATTASTHTAYTFFRAGNDVYISWSSGL